MLDEGKARKEPWGDNLREAHERIYGWKCYYCRTNSKGEKCDSCGKGKEEVRI